MNIARIAHVLSWGGMAGAAVGLIQLWHIHADYDPAYDSAATQRLFILVVLLLYAGFGMAIASATGLWFCREIEWGRASKPRLLAEQFRLSLYLAAAYALAVTLLFLSGYRLHPWLMNAGQAGICLGVACLPSLALRHLKSEASERTSTIVTWHVILLLLLLPWSPFLFIYWRWRRLPFERLPAAIARSKLPLLGVWIVAATMAWMYVRITTHYRPLRDLAVVSELILAWYWTCAALVTASRMPASISAKLPSVFLMAAVAAALLCYRESASRAKLGFYLSQYTDLPRAGIVIGNRLLSLARPVTPNAAAEPPLFPDAGRERRYDEPPRRGNFILISIDALRADHTSLFGYPRNTTPRIEEWARQQIVFTAAYAPAPYTQLSMTGVWTGQYRQAGQSDQSWIPQQWFQDREYAVWSWLWYVQVNHRHAVPPVNIENGWEDGLEKHPPVDEAIAFMESHPDQPVALWLHLMYPHAPYRTWPEVSPFGDTLLDYYDGEIAKADLEFGRFMDYLRQRKDYADTVIFVLSDHGEEFNEHGFLFHGPNIYDVNLRVPLILKIPSLPPRTIDRLVSLIDLAPTLCDIFHIPGKRDFHGCSLLPLCAGGFAPERPIFAQSMAPQRKAMMRDGDWKFLFDADTRVEELYYLPHDPGERNNLVHREDATTDRLRQGLQSWIEAGRDSFSQRLAGLNQDDPRSLPLLFRFWLKHLQKKTWTSLNLGLTSLVLLIFSGYWRWEARHYHTRAALSSRSDRSPDIE